MRSRYTAFALGEVGYLLATCVDETKADETKAALSSEQIAENCRTTTYLGLKIIAKSGGTRKHTEASVEFKVSYKSLGTIHTHHETSHFIKTNGSWKYLDGDVSIT
ncbi:MAG: hypothetical protein HRU29_00455 [Rhizobiales bacterium]|nr:hypothetical protein [Hyphomicrobiales bacterium]NRB12846.1 hypothetical protein [Hyphomicrobiales bacterium]